MIHPTTIASIGHQRRQELEAHARRERLVRAASDNGVADGTTTSTRRSRRFGWFRPATAPAPCV